jgi:hypothetical protein
MNAAALLAFDQRSAAVGEALWPGTVTISGTDYACTIIRPRQAQQLGDYAEEPEPVTLTVRIRKELLPTAPALHLILAWQEERWKIHSIAGQESTEAVWRIACQPAP